MFASDAFSHHLCTMPPISSKVVRGRFGFKDDVGNIGGHRRGTATGRFSCSSSSRLRSRCLRLATLPDLFPAHASNPASVQRFINDGGRAVFFPRFIPQPAFFDKFLPAADRPGRRLLKLRARMPSRVNARCWTGRLPVPPLLAKRVRFGAGNLRGGVQQCAPRAALAGRQDTHQ